MRIADKRERVDVLEMKSGVQEERQVNFWKVKETFYFNKKKERILCVYASERDEIGWWESNWRELKRVKAWDWNIDCKEWNKGIKTKELKNTHLRSYEMNIKCN